MNFSASNLCEKGEEKAASHSTEILTEIIPPERNLQVFKRGRAVLSNLMPMIVIHTALALLLLYVGLSSLIPTYNDHSRVSGVFELFKEWFCYSEPTVGFRG